MLEQIAQLVRQYGEDAVVNNSSVPDSQNNEIMAEATKTITSGMENMVAGGGLQDILAMFGQNGGNGLMKNPMVTMMIGHLISKLTGKFNLSAAQASQISNQLVPNVLNDLVTRTSSTAPEDDGFDLNDLIGTIGGGTGGFDFKQLIGQFTGQGSDGGFDIQEIVTQVTRGTQEKKASRNAPDAGAGLGDLIKGLFGG